MKNKTIKRKSFAVLLMIALLAAFIFMLNHAITRSQLDDGQSELVCRVTAADDSDMVISGAVMLGSQAITAEVIRGPHKGETLNMYNSFMGQYEFDQYLEAGDNILVGAHIADGIIIDAVPIDYYRQNYVIILFGLFAVFLVLYAGRIGLRALLSFVVSVLIIWLVLIPCLLGGYPPVPATVLTLLLLSAVIIFSVAGLTRKAFSAFLGSVSGIVIPVALAYIFGHLMKLQGLTEPYAINLIMKGYSGLDMQAVFYSAILIGASGACMDIAMDVAASMDEINIKRPDIKRGELIRSGFTIGKAVIGTMATTLLLAYSGSYLTLMLYFNVSGTSLIRLLNMKVFTTEAMRILIGSMALLFVAPLTAVISGYILKSRIGERWLVRRRTAGTVKVPETLNLP